MASRGLLEASFWVVLIAGSFGWSSVMLYRSFKGASDFPILTTVDTISIKRVPFPAVTVDAGGTINPWGLAERLLDLVDYECYETPLDRCADDKASWREATGFLTEAVVRRFFDVYVDKIKGLPLDELEMMREDMSFAGRKYKFKGYEGAAATLALIRGRDRSAADRAYSGLVEATARTFAMINPKFAASRAVPWGGDVFLPPVEEEGQRLGIAQEEVEACLASLANCSHYNEAYATMLLPFALNRIPYEGLGAGTFMSYYTRRVLSGTLKNTVRGDTVLFLQRAGDSNRDEEIEVAALLTAVTDYLAGRDVGISLYELANLLDRPHSLDENGSGQAPYVGDSHGCSQRHSGKVTGKYLSAWTSYLTGRSDYIGDVSGVVTQRPCSNDTLDEMLGISGCCGLAGVFREERELATRVMKFAVQTPHFTQSHEEFLGDFGEAPEAFPYRLKPVDNSSTAPTYDNPRIRLCRYDQVPSDDGRMPFCNIFVRSYSNEGLAYTFNNRHFWSKHRSDNEYNRLFHDVMHPEPTTDFPDVIYPRTSGSFYGLTVVLELNKYQVCVCGCVGVTLKVYPTNIAITKSTPSVATLVEGSDVVDIWATLRFSYH